nr:immunoglobulin light chain junction region [Macaca mulatta]
GMQALQTPYSF